MDTFAKVLLVNQRQDGLHLKSVAAIDWKAYGSIIADK